MPVLDVQHDSAHPVEADSAWSEAWLFGGYDPITDCGLDTRIGIRPNEGTIDIWMEVWLPEGRYAHLLATGPKSEIVDGDLQISGIRYERLAPLHRWGGGGARLRGRR